MLIEFYKVHERDSIPLGLPVYKTGALGTSLRYLRACLGISGMKRNEGHWGGEISIISQNFPKSPLILFHPLESSISQTSPKGNYEHHRDRI
jgi:hypothetical protein